MRYMNNNNANEQGKVNGTQKPNTDNFRSGNPTFCPE